MEMEDFEIMVKNKTIKFLFTTHYYNLIKNHYKEHYKEYYTSYKKPLVFTFIPNRESKSQLYASNKTNAYASFRSKKSTSLNPKEIEIDIAVPIGERGFIENYGTFTKYIIQKRDKDIVYYVFLNPNDLENPHIYWIIENTNQNITVEISPVTEHRVSITPLDLSVDTMQLAINTNSLQIVKPTEEDEYT